MTEGMTYAFVSVKSVILEKKFKIYFGRILCKLEIICNVKKKYQYVIHSLSVRKIMQKPLYFYF